MRAGPGQSAVHHVPPRRHAGARAGQVTFNEFRNGELEAKEVKRETADYSKLHVVGQGETLSAIAGRACYGNPAPVAAIAIRNGIDDPFALATGQQLLIPQLPFAIPRRAR